MAEFRDHLVPEKDSEDSPSLGRTGWAESATGATERQQVLTLAGVAGDSGKAPVEIATIGEGIDHAVDEAAPTTVARLEALFLSPFDRLVALLDQAVER